MSGYISNEIRERVYKNYTGTFNKNIKCPICGDLMGFKDCKSNYRKTCHIAHLIPKSKGGPDHPFNLRPICPDCNWEMQDTSVWRYIDEIRYTNNLPFFASQNFPRYSEVLQEWKEIENETYREYINTYHNEIDPLDGFLEYSTMNLIFPSCPV